MYVVWCRRNGIHYMCTFDSVEFLQWILHERFYKHNKQMANAHSNGDTFIKNHISILFWKIFVIKVLLYGRNSCVWRVMSVSRLFLSLSLLLVVTLLFVVIVIVEVARRRFPLIMWSCISFDLRHTRCVSMCIQNVRAWITRNGNNHKFDMRNLQLTHALTITSHLHSLDMCVFLWKHY